MKRKKIPERRVGTLDSETDPFKANRVPMPFAWCVYFSDDNYATFWGKKSTYLVAEYLRSLPKCTLWAHNGGKFDFFYLLEYANVGSVTIRNGRIVRFKIGRCTLKDSFPLMPFPLADYQKTVIDYQLFEEDRREDHREKITAYMVDDCRDLLILVRGFQDVVGLKETIGGAAFFQMKQLRYKILNCGEYHDSRFRPFYYGGRVQAIRKGIFKGRFYVYDINSAYSRAMLEKHASGKNYKHTRTLPKNFGSQFIRILAISRGALPFRDGDELQFPNDDTPREYFVTGWEVGAALETNSLTILRIIDVWTSRETINFRVYVETFFALRKKAKEIFDKIKDLAYKYLLNSGYGKFAQNPRDFKDYKIAIYGENVPGWDYEADFGGLTIWSRPSYEGSGFYDVATGASITGYVRACLWRAVHAAGPTGFYCDTDCIILEGLGNEPPGFSSGSGVICGSNLGEWKIEGIGTEIAIAGKKLYGVKLAPEYWKTDKRTGKIIKHKIASKGARLEYADIRAICKGDTKIWENAAPTFSIKEGARFIKREIRQT